MKFSGGINEITEDNGFGKTTIASFIKAMFYGLAPCRANGKDFNDRKKFYPFSGGKFGGFIEFVSGGDEYRIERFFGKKSDLDDEMKVYKNSAETSELSPIPGLKLFGLDEESFEKTLFIDSEITEISSTGAINGLLGDFAQDVESGISFEDALAKLEAARKKYKAAKGNNDLISQTQAEISGLKTKIENIEKVYRLFKGHTFYIQKTFNEAFADTPKGKECTLEIIKTAIDNLIAYNDTIFREILSNIPEKQKELLYAIAKVGEAENVTSAKFIKRYSLTSASSVQSATKKLLEKDIITEINKVYSVTDKFFGMWINTIYGNKYTL